MPTYEFFCPVCGDEVELTLSIAEYKDQDNWPECEGCGNPLARIWAPVPNQFVGGRPSSAGRDPDKVWT